MSSKSKMHSPEISEDDDSFEDPDMPHLMESMQKKNIVLLSSDEDDNNSSAIDISSDEGPTLPPVIINSNKHEIDRGRIINNLFSNTKNDTKEQTLDSSKTKMQFTSKHIKMIEGVEVILPVQPYGCQIALMSKVITGIKKSKNCLLESPTGSGKTLALLCAALAWQKHEKNRIANLFEEQCSMMDLDNPETRSEVSSEFSPNNSTNYLHRLLTNPTFGGRSIYDSPRGNRDSEVSSVHTEKRLEPDTSKSKEYFNENLVTIHKRRKLYDTSDSSRAGASHVMMTPDKAACTSSDDVESPRSASLPTIYYGARTHKQIQQVIKEFQRTAYCGDARMTILSSREYSCIREFDRQIYASKNEMCKECCAPKKGESSNDKNVVTNCSYFDGRERIDHTKMPPAFDLEDLVVKGREVIACPHYAARAMAASAHIIFCPYNYLIDPFIRSGMKINVTNEIVILDEAHNIEDICRDAATFCLKWDDFTTAITDLEAASQYKSSANMIMDDLLYLLQAMRNWDYWFVNHVKFLETKPVVNNETVFTWEVEDFVESIDNHNIGRKHYKEFIQRADRFSEVLRDSAIKVYKVTQSTCTLIESIAVIYKYLFREGGKFMDDYKPALVRTSVDSYRPHTDASGWRSAHLEQVNKVTTSLRMLCMNPSVVFSGLHGARSILLSSGTLTPLHSLHSELATDFPLRISPSHIIPRNRVWVGTLGTGPTGHPLECKMRDTSMVHTQDALGDAVVWVCKVTPHGVLCFLPSYYLMTRLIKRWRETGVWQKLVDLKHVFEESRNVKDHNEIMQDYYSCVETDKGALLFAVYRGKVSEGMDFRDRQARAVITVGIPYPNTTDLMISEKMKFNDKHCLDRSLLKSKEWLRMQAYRALNQAVGRCVRHRNDWGAVLLIDARFRSQYYTEHLSGWVRNFLGSNHHTFNSLLNRADSLQSFMQSMSLEQDEENL